MSRKQHRWGAVAALVCVLSVALLFTRCADSSAPTSVTSAAKPITGDPMHTASSGSVSTLLGRANFAGDAHKFFPFFHVSRSSADWGVLVTARPNLDLAVQRIVFEPGGSSGWHQHPGPVFIQVVTGTMTFYEADDRHCRPIVRTPGQGYLDDGTGHIARNETALPAENIVVYLAPQGATLRIDAPARGNCPF